MDELDRLFGLLVGALAREARVAVPFPASDVYVRLEPDNVREAMQREIATINPDPAYFRSFPDAQVMVNGRAAERVMLADRAYAPPSGGADEEEQLSDATGEN